MFDTLETVAPGAPVYSRDRRGFIAAIEAETARTFTLGTGAMRPVTGKATIVWDSGTISPDIPNTMAEDWITEARRLGFPDVPDYAERFAAARAAQAEARAQRKRDADAAATARTEFQADAAGKIPRDAKAVIYAEFHRDDSDTMSDYFNSKVERVVILGFSTHTRDLFPELRKAARNFPETASLADAPASAEHREKWSMGAGYYLAAGNYRHDTGWQVRKRSLPDGTPTERARGIPSGTWSLAAPQAERTEATAAGAFTIEKHTHTKRGFDMWICIMLERVERDEFDRLRTAAEALGGWYSRPWGKTPGGFAFKSEADAQAFANPSPSNPPDNPEPPPGGGKAGTGDKLRALADGMQGDIDHKLGDRLSNTPKRQRQAAQARMEGARLQRAQRGLRALADMHDAGTVPPELAKVTTKAAAVELARSEIDRRNAGYYDAGIDTGRPALDTPEAAAFWQLIGGGPTDAERDAEELRRKIDGLRFAKIPGYFPTPPDIVARMIDEAGIPEGEALDILEPSAGSGAIADAVREARPGVRLSVFEVNATLSAILRAKGHAIAGHDFMDYHEAASFDRVLMNAPFEKGQDIDHVRRAFDCLKPGGRLVAIMSGGVFYRQDRKATEFRAWVEANGGTWEDLPAGAFKESGTGVTTALVVIDRAAPPAAAPQMPAGTRVGTCHFASVAAARAYYRGQGYGADAVLDKIEAAEIVIGAPAAKPGERLELDSDGRYVAVVEG